MTSDTKATAKTPSSEHAGDRKTTKVQQDGASAPRLPSEHDQSSDSQRNVDGSAPDVGRQALDDIEHGLVDTDRGPVTDRIYNDKVKP